MKHRLTSIGSALSVCLLSAGITAAQTPADNTKVNQRDRQASAVTSDQQSNNRSDVDITRLIRKSIVDDKSLSTYAHNVKIVTKAGQVTLKGPVRSDDEKASIEAKANGVAGSGHVVNQLTVKGPARTSTATSKRSTKKVGN